MKKLISALLFGAALLLSGCQTESEVGTTGFVPLVSQPPVAIQTVPTVQTEPEVLAEDASQVISRVCDVPWQRRTLSDSGYLFMDSTIPVYAYTQEEMDAALGVVNKWIDENLLTEENSYGYSQLLAIAPDLMASSEQFLSEELENKDQSLLSHRRNYPHYLDFDVVVYSENAAKYGEPSIHVYHVGLYRDELTDPATWRVRSSERDFREEAYTDLTDSDTVCPEAYRPLSFEELEANFSYIEEVDNCRILFATEMLYQENTTWVYVYYEEYNKIHLITQSYSNPDPYPIPLPAPKEK